MRSSLRYLRFLRINFHPLEAFGIQHGKLTSIMVFVLVQNLLLGSGEVMRDMEDMVALIPEVLALDVSTSLQIKTVLDLAEAANKTDIFRRKDTQQLTDRLITILREATMPHPDSHVFFALASCLSVRFQTRHLINDYEEAMAIADKIIADTPGYFLTTKGGLSLLTSVLLTSRWNSHPRPEYLEDTIHRVRTLISLPTIPDIYRTHFTALLEIFTQQRFHYFGITGNSRHPFPNPSKVRNISHLHALVLTPQGPQRSGVVLEDDPIKQMMEKLGHLNDISDMIQDDETADVEVEAAIEKAVELSRTFLPLQQSSHQWTFMPASVFARLLSFAYRRTKKLDYLHNSITLSRDLLKVLPQTAERFYAREWLLHALSQRANVLQLREDFEEAFQLYSLLVNDGVGSVSLRFNLSLVWATSARHNAHPSMSTAYQAAMSLMQETLVFSPTLQTQHFRLTCMSRDDGSWLDPTRVDCSWRRALYRSLISARPRRASLRCSCSLVQTTARCVSLSQTGDRYCHETTARGGTLLESIVPDVELCNVRRFQQGFVEPACGVPVASSRLLLVVFLCPKTETSILGKKSSGEEL